jgi:glycerol-3-phosphate acyltransferase PlsX
VCDGFTGNIVLKVSEGLVEMIAGGLREGFDAAADSPAAEALRVFEKRVHHDEYGAAPLLGVAGLAFVGHGRSSARAVQSGIAMAYRFASSDFIARVQQEIAAAGEPHQ